MMDTPAQSELPPSYEGYEPETPDYSDHEGPEEWPRDKKIDEARKALLEYFEKHRDSVFYMKQLGVLFERQFFHWITFKAINELIGGDVRSEERELAKGTRVKFIFHRSNRYYRRRIQRILAIVKEYSGHVIAAAAGRQAEVLFSHALALRGFALRGQNAREFGGKLWTRTGHNLDFIFERDGRVYGCEVKNTWDYIPRDELAVKLEMCAELGLMPLFIVRSAPKSYVHRVAEFGGFTLVFEAQIYPFGQDGLVAAIRNELGLPVDCPRAIPAGIIDRFEKWHKKKVGV